MAAHRPAAREPAGLFRRPRAPLRGGRRRSPARRARPEDRQDRLDEARHAVGCRERRRPAARRRRHGRGLPGEEREPGPCRRARLAQRQGALGDDGGRGAVVAAALPGRRRGNVRHRGRSARPLPAPHGEALRDGHVLDEEGRTRGRRRPLRRRRAEPRAPGRDARGDRRVAQADSRRSSTCREPRPTGAGSSSGSTGTGCSSAASAGTPSPRRAARSCSISPGR